MIIYLFNEEYIKNITISTRLVGMYPINIDDKVVANIYLEDNKWNIRFSDEFNTDCPQEELSLYKVYILISKYGNKRYAMIALPKYDENLSLIHI